MFKRNLCISLIIGMFSIGVFADEPVVLTFTRDAKILFDKGIKKEEILQTTTAYNFFEINKSYRVSVLNSILTCFETQPGSFKDELKKGIVGNSELLAPIYFCEATINTAVENN